MEPIKETSIEALPVGKASSLVSSLWHDPSQSTLYVRFKKNKALVRYYNVGQDVASCLREEAEKLAGSVGSLLHSLVIKRGDLYPFDYPTDPELIKHLDSVQPG